MTLIINEIHLIDGLRKTAIVSAADRLITIGGKHDSHRRKVFKIPFLHATVSYFGLAGFTHPKSRKNTYFSEWVPNEINKLADCSTLKDLAVAFRKALNETIPANGLKHNPSGFHFCGYNSAGLPELWYLSNIGTQNLQTGAYGQLLNQYGELSEDFLLRDARSKFRFDGLSLGSAMNGIQHYRNGDTRAHGIVWLHSEEIFTYLEQFPDFRKPTIENLVEYKKFVRFKFQFLSSIYEHWCKRKIIGKPIDIFILAAPEGNHS